MNTTKTKSLTYFGRRAGLTEIRRTTKAFCERVAIIEWTDDADERNGGHTAGTVVARHIEGDGRDASFQLLAEGTFYSMADAVAWAEQRLAA